MIVVVVSAYFLIAIGFIVATPEKVLQSHLFVAAHLIILGESVVASRSSDRKMFLGLDMFWLQHVF